MAGEEGAALNLPAAFISHNADDPAWLAALPTLLQRLAEQWSLTLAPPFPGIRLNYVAPATRADGSACVLKASRHVDETRNEIAALQLWAGRGSARLLMAEPDNGALLLERLQPGTMLVTVAETDDEAATTIAAKLLRQLWCPAPPESGLRSLTSWCAAYDRNRAALSAGAASFPADLFRRADALRQELLASTTTPMTLHGDLHHFNILRAQRAEWLTIDPKGLLGDPCFDVCQFLRNPSAMPLAVNRRRLDHFCALLGLDPTRTRAWCFVHAMLDACWDYEEENPWQAAVAYAQETLSL